MDTWRDFDMYVDEGVHRPWRERGERVGVYHGQQGRPVERQVPGTPFDFDQLRLAVGIETKDDAWSPLDWMGRSSARFIVKLLPNQPL